MKLAEAFLTKNAEFLRGYALAEFGIELTAEQATAIAVFPLPYMKSQSVVKGVSLLRPDSSDSCWRLWLKKRMEALNLFSAGSNGSPEINLAVTLHVFDRFYRSAEENARLLYITPDEKKWKKQTASVARSKVFQETSRVPHPIDGTASRVAPEDKPHAP